MTSYINWTLYIILDMGLLSKGNVLDVAESVLVGGATVLQFRAKHWPLREQVAAVEALLPIAHRYHVPLLVNDHVDIALAIHADGVHLGSSDLPIRLARQLMPNGLIGYSPDGLVDAALATAEGANYLGVGPFAPTLTKPDAGQPIQSSGLSTIVEAVSIPVIAIGGISTRNAAQAISAGANGVAVASSIICAANPVMAARELRFAVDDALTTQKANGVLAIRKTN